MILHDCKQGEPAWFQARAGVVTASELSRIVTDLGNIRMKDGEWSDGARTYICEKISERWLGGPLQSFAGGAAEQGSVLEDEAIPWLETHWRSSIARPGFITTDDGSFGCSPDGLAVRHSPASVGVEIKCPQPANHVRWLLAGVCPLDHVLQIQGGMYATDADRWWFVSYCRGFPKLVVGVDRDEKMQDAIHEAVRLCNDAIRDGYAKLVEKNGGKEPKRRVPPVREDDPFAASMPDAAINMKAGSP